MSLVITRQDGFLWRCDGCSQMITESGLAIFRPMDTKDQTEVLTVHRRCTKLPVIETLMPRYSSRPLQQVAQQLLDTLPAEG